MLRDPFNTDDMEDVVIVPRVGSIDGAGVVPRSTPVVVAADTGAVAPSPGADRRMLRGMNANVNEVTQNIRDAREAGYAERSPRMISLGTDLTRAVADRHDSVTAALARKRARMGR